MEPDAIVFSQEELEKALESGARRILLCDGDFYLENPPEEAEFSVLGTAAVYSGGQAVCLSSSPGEYRRTAAVAGSGGVWGSGGYRTSGGVWGSGGYRTSGGIFALGSWRTSGGMFTFGSWRSSGGMYGSGMFAFGSGRKISERRFSGPYSEGLDELFYRLELEGIGGYGIQLI